MTLMSQINDRSKDISTDSYSMSVGELINMYRDGELDLHPEFQRFFRWTIEQKSRFIESLLLGIPIPSIFVAQREKGTWEVVDGLQRISTLFELSGELKDRDGVKKPQLVLTKTKYLPLLEGLRWSSENDSETLPEEAKLRIKRARVDVNIILSNSDKTAKYELFQRLNTGAAFATDQEVRNCILVMINSEFFSWISELARDENFRACIPMTDRAFEEQFDLELVTRFIVLRNLSIERIREMNELGSFLDDNIVSMAEDRNFDREELGRAFRRTFEVFSRLLGEDSFKKYDNNSQRAKGAMLISVFEVLAIGLGHYAGDQNYQIIEEKVVLAHKRISSETSFNAATGSGIRASTRLPITIKLGRDLFAP